MPDETSIIIPELRSDRRGPVSRRINGTPPARDLTNAVRLCDPYSPLDPNIDKELHINLNGTRASDPLARIVRNIKRSGGIQTLHLVGGHVGSGKTTELLRMKEQLATGQNAATVFFLDASQALNQIKVDLEDILIGLWALLWELDAKAALSVYKPMLEGQFKNHLKDILGDIPGTFNGLLGKLLSGLKIGGDQGQGEKIRLALRPMTDSLIDGLNQAFEKLPAHIHDPEAPIVALIDNLEKLSENRRESVEALYLGRMAELKKLQAHLVITVPLYLCYAASGASLIGLYGGEIFVIPMIEVRRPISKGGGDNEAGIALMVELLSKRVDFNHLFEDKNKAAEQIARASGGCMRHAIRILLTAINEQDGPPITAQSIQISIGTMQADYERALPEQYVSTLKEIAKINRFPDGLDGNIKRELLQHLYVLEYRNGSPEPWYAVHPLVERCRKYRES